MGHVRAVDWAQLGHCNFLRAHGGLLDTEVLLYRASVPRGPTWDGVMLDDRVLMREAPRGVKLGESAQAAAAVRAYPRFGLEAKPSKRERDALETEFWGAHVHGGEGWTRVNDSGLRRPVGASLALCEMGAVSGDLWRSCRSLWPNALLYRRCALGLMDHVYSFDPPDAHVARIPQRVKSELLALVALSPLFWTNLRAPVSTELGAWPMPVMVGARWLPRPSANEPLRSFGACGTSARAVMCAARRMSKPFCGALGTRASRTSRSLPRQLSPKRAASCRI